MTARTIETHQPDYLEPLEEGDLVFVSVSGLTYDEQAIVIRLVEYAVLEAKTRLDIDRPKDYGYYKPSEESLAERFEVGLADSVEELRNKVLAFKALNIAADSSLADDLVERHYTFRKEYTLAMNTYWDKDICIGLMHILNDLITDCALIETDDRTQWWMHLPTIRKHAENIRDMMQARAGV